MMETKSEHTPGPWKYFTDTRYGPYKTDGKRGNPHYHQWWIESDTRKCVAVLEVPYLALPPIKHEPSVIIEHTETVREVEANACLIAAAPELLQVLKDCLQSLERLPDVDGAYRVTCISEAKQAIAKAEGSAI
jgi:hypothetical protein